MPEQIAGLRGSAARFDLVVWAGLEDPPGAVAGPLSACQDAGATWWIELPRAAPRWWQRTQARVARGP